MSFFFLVLLGCFILFLYRLYHLATDDYVLLKKNVSLEQIFNAAFACSFIALFFSRFFHVLFHPQPVYLSILGFLLFPYFPGLSLTGGVLGGFVSLYIFGKVKHLPIGRVFDFFSMALLWVLPIGLLGFFLLSQEITPGGIVRLIMYVALLLGATLYLFPRVGSLEMKDGTVSILFFIFLSLASLLGNGIDQRSISVFFEQKENYVLLLAFGFSVILLIKQELLGRIS